ncbi:MAG: Ig-like domain-containing protein, partial [Actinomycetes bacterium]
MPSLVRTGRKPLAAIIAAATLLLGTSCSGGEPTASGFQQQKQTKPAPPPPTITVAPAEGAKRVRPDKPVVVTASGGKLEKVVVRAGRHVVDGRLDDSGTRWRSTERLRPATTYTVEAQAVGDGGPTQVNSKFTTLKPQNELAVIDVTPAVKGEILGVGAPIIVTFNRPVEDKAA